MEELSLLKEQKKKYLSRINTLQHSGSNIEEEARELFKKLNDVHSRILEIELKNPSTLKLRVGYSVCGWSEKHDYFRNKYFVSETLREAKVELEKLKKDPTWGIPTIIVQEKKLRRSSPRSVDFDNADFEHLGSSDDQKVISKSMCGNKKFRWKDLLHGPYTY